MASATARPDGNKFKPAAHFERTGLRDMGARMQDFEPPAAVVVGIDGSQAAVRAALWAIDEAVDRDIPLRLIYAIDPRDIRGTDPDSAAHRLSPPTPRCATRSWLSRHLARLSRSRSRSCKKTQSPP